ncbi:DUF2855 family protein [Sandaracinobacter neustonicus]|nr:DUF2855 family protein [Sandaracinobacter neustonicus]
MKMTRYAIEIDRADLSRQEKVSLNLTAGEGEIIAEIELASITSNNITYAVMGGEPFNYWNFFPASDPARGIVPLWGYATISESRSPHVAEGSRLFGYWPSATHLKLLPGPAKSGGFTDLAPHRQGLAPVYNSYRPTPGITPETEPLIALFQPLYGTGFVLAQSLGSDIAAGRSILLTSASAKTALATAFNLQRAGGMAIGLTSAANRAFVENTGFYAQVLTYEELESLDPATPSVLVDFAGNGALKARIHRHLKSLSASHIVGDTDWAAPSDEPLEGPPPTLFFAPTHWADRIREIGQQAFDHELNSSMAAFLATTPHWLTVETHSGPKGYMDSFNRLLSNKLPPNIGLVWKP